MIYVCHLTGVMMLCLLQTVILGYTFLHTSFYDLFCPFIIYLSIFRPAREALPVIVASGMVMDSLCGGPTGMYITAYIWVWIGTRALITWLYAGNPMILLFIVALAVVLENILMFLLFALFKSGNIHSALMFKIMLNHFMWAVLTGPSILLVIKFMYDKWDIWYGCLTEAEHQHLP